MPLEILLANLVNTKAVEGNFADMSVIYLFPYWICF
jgi:hypothetical protein